MTDEKVIWTLDTHPKFGLQAIGTGKGCPVLRQQIADTLGPYSAKVFLNRYICAPPEKKEGKV